MIPAIITTLLSIGADWLKGRHERQKAKLDSELKVIAAETDARIRMADRDQVHEHRWAELAMQNSNTSWKDEFWTIVLAIPAILVFIPGMAEFVMAGFAALEAMPIWYQGALTGAIAAAFGLSKLRRFQSTKAAFGAAKEVLNVKGN